MTNAILVCLIAYCALLSALRSNLYSDDFKRTQIEAQYHPASAFSHYEAGRIVLARIGKDIDEESYAAVRSHFETAGRLKPGLEQAWLGLLHLSCLTGRTPEARWIEQMEVSLRNGPIGSSERNLLRALAGMSVAGMLCMSREEVERLYGSVIGNQAASASAIALAHAALADYLIFYAHDFSTAERELKAALGLMPGVPRYTLRMAELAFIMGQNEKARMLLNDVRESGLKAEEKAFMSLLRICLGSGQDAAKCDHPQRNRPAGFH